MNLNLKTNSKALEKIRVLKILSQTGTDSNYTFKDPVAVCIVGEEILLADSCNRMIVIDQRRGTLLRTFGDPFKFKYGEECISQISANKTAEFIVVTTKLLQHIKHRVYNYSDGEFSFAFGKTWMKIIYHGIAIDKEDRILFVETVNKVAVFNKNGAQIKSIVCYGVGYPHGIAVSEEEKIFIGDLWNHCVQIYNYEGNHLKCIGNNLLRSTLYISMTSQGDVLVAHEQEEEYLVSLISQEGEIKSTSVAAGLINIYGTQFALMPNDDLVVTTKSNKVIFYQQPEQRLDVHPLVPEMPEQELDLHPLLPDLPDQELDPHPLDRNQQEQPLDLHHVAIDQPEQQFVPHPLVLEQPEQQMDHHPFVLEQPEQQFVPHPFVLEQPEQQMDHHPLVLQQPEQQFVPHPFVLEHPEQQMDPHQLFLQQPEQQFVPHPFVLEQPEQQMDHNPLVLQQPEQLYVPHPFVLEHPEQRMDPHQLVLEQPEPRLDMEHLLFSDQPEQQLDLQISYAGQNSVPTAGSEDAHMRFWKEIFNRNRQRMKFIKEHVCDGRLCAVAVDSQNRVIVVDVLDKQVGVFDYAGASLFFGDSRSGFGELVNPLKVASDPQSCSIVVLDYDGVPNMKIFDQDGNYRNSFFCSLVDNPIAMTVSNMSQIAVVQFSVYHVAIYNLTGTPMEIIKCSNLKSPTGIAVCNDQVFITDCADNCVKEYNFSGNLVRIFSDRDITPFPVGIAITRSGYLAVVDAAMDCRLTFFDSSINWAAGYTTGQRHGNVVGFALTTTNDVWLLCDDGKLLYYSTQTT